MLKSIAINIYKDFTEDIYEIGREVLLVLNKNNWVGQNLSMPQNSNGKYF